MKQEEAMSKKISPLAGKPAPSSILVNLQELITVYYVGVPDPLVLKQRISFGTSGHRGSSLEKTFNERHILAISQAICLYRKQKSITGPLFLGIDTHALSRPAFSSALEVLAANGIDIMIAKDDEFTPTPVISHAILAYNHARTAGLADGIVITPSHNPPHDGGFKYNPPNGGPASPDVTSWIEKKANELLENNLRGVKRIPFEQALRAPTTHQYDYLNAYVNDLVNVIDMDLIRDSKIHIAVDPLGGAGVHYWPVIAERYGLNLTVVNEVIDPTFRFMAVDWDGQIRMDPSSPYAMAGLIQLKDEYDLAFACDTDHDRHGIVARSVGLLPPNHYLSVALSYLFQYRPKWNKSVAVGKTIVSTQMIDRITAKLGRKLYEVPVGFRWFVDGLFDGSVGFSGEESAGASFLRLDGSVWTTDKDGIILALLAAEMTARVGRDPGQLYQDLIRQFGEVFFKREDSKATPKQKKILEQLTSDQLQITELAGQKIQHVFTHAPSNGEPIGGVKVVTNSGWFVVRPSGTENIYKVYAESADSEVHLSQILTEAHIIVNQALGGLKKKPLTQATQNKAVQDKAVESTSLSQFSRVKNVIYDLLPTNIEGINFLHELALDMRWASDHAADKLWEEIDTVQWQLTHNPLNVLQTASRERIAAKLADPGFRKKMDTLIQKRRKVVETPGWFQETYPDPPLKHIAYFCMEFMLTEFLPIYSGGLGNVAGDQLKTASYLGVPVTGVGLLYQQGYFRQVIDKEGEQEAYFPYNDFLQLPVTPLRHLNGEWLRVKIDFLTRIIWLRVWQVRIGKLKLYLLDSNDMANFPQDRAITSKLYGGGPTERLMQEVVLGIGGWQLFEILGIEPDVCHLNEGHAAFAILERARCFMEKTGQPFDLALAVTRMGNLFTTHTPVPAGFDRFEPELIERHLGDYIERKLGISCQDFLALGRENPNDPTELFNMAYLGIRGSGAVNGVSCLHGRVSRHLFLPIFPRWPVQEIPVGYITNGIHVPSWDSEAAHDLWTTSCGKNRWMGTAEELEPYIREIPDHVFWQLRINSRKALINYVRDALPKQIAVYGASPESLACARASLSPNVLTIGFARRFATYKRPNLLLHDPERLIRMLTNAERPIQIILAGKAHPADKAGQAMIKQWIDFLKRPEVCQHVVFLSDYDMFLTQHLVQGVDVWLNTPRRPWEACGTSGMKVLANGGINLSELDGWWAEAYAPEVGWALGDGKEHGDDPAWDAAEAESLYNLLEHEVIPEFYTRDDQGIPTAWVARMRESMARLTGMFSCNRAVREYTEKHYLPAAIAYHKRAADKGAIGKQVMEWKHTLEEKWAGLRFGDLTVRTEGEYHVFEVQVYFNDLNPKTVKIELYANGMDKADPVRLEMAYLREQEGLERCCLYHVAAPASRPVEDYSARIIPYYEGVSVPLEAAYILWQR